MEDKRREEDAVTSELPNNETEVKTIENNTTETSVVSDDVKKDNNEVVSQSVTPAKKSYSLMTYVITGLIVIVMAVGLIFLLEKQGRINTGLFTDIIAEMKAKAPAAKVNGVVIPNSDFDSGVKQLQEMAKMQGVDVADEKVLGELKTQAIETLVNGELLRQSAIEEGIEVDKEAVDARFNEISEGVGGKEELDKKMAEFDITEESLRRDIENEILIQDLFDKKANKDAIEVSETEIADLYKQITASASGKDVPTLADMREDIVAELRNRKQQEQITTYIEELKDKAEIEILI